MIRGASVQVPALIGLRKEAQKLSLTTPTHTSWLHGNHASRFISRGMEFEEVRCYQPGDDVRAIDWRVTARLSQPHTKLFRAERERPILLFIDQRQSMFFGSQRCFKSVCAAEAGSLLSWLAVNNGDQIGGIVFGNTDYYAVRPRPGKANLLRFLHHTALFNNQLTLRNRTHSLHLADYLQKIRRTAHTGSSVFLISDFYDFDQKCEKYIRILARHCSLTAFCVRDPLEEQLPNDGIYYYSDGAQQLCIDARAPQVQNAYQEYMQAPIKILQQLPVSVKMITTEQPVVEQLRKGKI